MPFRGFILVDKMIRNFSDHSANERTFLAWVGTAIAVMAFGFLVEKIRSSAVNRPRLEMAASLPNVAPVGPTESV